MIVCSLNIKALLINREREILRLSIILGVLLHLHSEVSKFIDSIELKSWKNEMRARKT